MLNSILDRNTRQINKSLQVVATINKLENEVEKMSFADMQKEIAEFRSGMDKLRNQLPEESHYSLKTFNRGAGLPPLEKEIQDKLLAFMPRFYAFVREISRRKMDRRHFDIQLAAAVNLAEGQKLAEIKTGEGKTQIFFLTTFLYALAGRGSHSITVNDYLAKRDGESAGHIASELGMSVGIITPAASYKFVPDDKLAEIKGAEAAAERKELPDLSLSNMHGINLVQCEKREAYLCDITFGTNNEFGFDYLRDNMSWNLSDLVQRELYYCVVDEADSVLIDEARTPLIISSPGEGTSELYSRFAKAVTGLEETKHYVIDYKTRSVTLTEEGIDKASQLLGVDNIWEDYAFAHHLQNALTAKALYVLDDHYIVRDGEVLIVDQFTGRVLPGRRYSEGLHQAIEAKEGVEIKRESRTFATISFQNYFRLYKILIGGSGTIETEKEEFFKIYGLDTLVVPTNRTVVRKDEKDRIFKNQAAKFRAVAQEVKERHEAGQPVLIGTTSIERSELVSSELTRIGVPHQVLNAKYHEKEAQIVAQAGQKGAVTVATNMAGRGTDIPLGEGVKEVGGLAVIGTERHEARRIDNQLRGRSGRQGDPGYSRFYVSMDDTIMKMLGGEILEKLMEFIKVPDDQPIEMGMISKRIEDAQKRVEWANFDTRKHLVEYDDVMNQQREVFYARRHQFLVKAEGSIGFFMIDDKITDVNAANATEQLKEKMKQMQVEIKKHFAELILDELDYIVSEQFSGKDKLATDEVRNLVTQYLDIAIEHEIARVFGLSNTRELNELLTKEVAGKNEDGVFEYLSEPTKKLIAQKVQELGEQFFQLYKMVMLEALNTKWVDHLEHMQDIREGIGLQGYAQKDPLIEYKAVAYTAFEKYLDHVNSSVARRFLKIKAVAGPTIETTNLITNQDEIEDILTGDREFLKPGYIEGEVASSANEMAEIEQAVASSNKTMGAANLMEKIRQQAQTEKQVMEQASSTTKTIEKSDSDKIGRNDPCPCGSGKKYKKCGMINSAEHQQNMAKR